MTLLRNDVIVTNCARNQLVIAYRSTDSIFNSATIVIMADREEERPFKAEYAKSGRAGCKLCKGAITQGSLRLAKMVQVR